MVARREKLAMMVLSTGAGEKKRKMGAEASRRRAVPYIALHGRRRRNVHAMREGRARPRDEIPWSP